MSDIQKASADATEAIRQVDTYAAVLAALQAAQRQGQQPACVHHQQTAAPAASTASAAKWVGIGVGGSFLAVSLAVSMVAFAIGAVSVTVCLLVLRGLWNEATKKR